MNDTDIKPTNGHEQHTLRSGLLRLLPQPVSTSPSLPISASSPVPGITPELHLVPSTGPVLTFTTQDRVQRLFLCLSIPPAPHMSAVIFDPSVPEECQVFGMNDNVDKFGSHKRFAGYGVLASTKDGNGVITTMYLTPACAEFKAQPWQPAVMAPPEEIVWLEDPHGRQALGYATDGGQHQILSGPPNFHPVKFHFALASRMTGGVS